MLLEVLEKTLDRLPQVTQAAGRYSGSFFQAAANGWLGEMENQIIRAQARNVSLSIEALQRVIEIVGQEDRLHPAATKNLVFPTRRLADLR